MRTKTPYERFPLVFNFGYALEAGESISTVDIVVEDSASGTSHVPLVASGGFTADGSVVADGNMVNGLPWESVFLFYDIIGQEVWVYVQDGDEGDVYHIEVSVTTDQGNVFDKDAYLKVETAYNNFVKQPKDRHIFAADFSKRLVNDSILSVDVTATDTDGEDSTLTIIDSSDQEGDQVLVAAIAGEDGEIHRILAKVVTVNGNLYQVSVMMKVQEL